MKTILKTSVAAAALMALAAPAMATIENGQAKVKLKVYGQVHKALLWGDDGNNDRTMVVDGQVSSTRLGFLADAPVNADFSFGANLEMEWRSNQGSAVAVNNGGTGGGTALDNGQGSNNFTERKAEVTMTHKRFGKLSLGQGDEAAQDFSEYNLSGAALASGVLSSTSYLTNTALYNKNTNAYVTTTLGAVFGNIDGDRDDRIRYDTPTFMGFSLGASFTSGGGSAVGVKYDGKVGQFKILGGVAYNSDSGISSTTEDEVLGSVSVLHDSGLNATFAYGVRNHKTPASVAANKPDDAEFIGGQVGYIAKIFGVGPTAFAADYYRTTNLNRANTSSTTTEWEVDTFGIGVQQDFSDIGASAFMTYRNYSIDTTAALGLNIDDVNLVLAGVRVQF
jgi:hypothetical protein